MSRRIVAVGGSRNGATHRPYRPTSLQPAARTRDRVAAVGAVFLMAAMIAAFLMMGV